MQVLVFTKHNATGDELKEAVRSDRIIRVEDFATHVRIEYIGNTGNCSIYVTEDFDTVLTLWINNYE